MNRWQWALKLGLDYSGVGACCYLLWSLIDKWAGKFLEAHTAQVAAMGTQAAATAALASAVKEARDNGQDVVMAVQLLAARIEHQGQYLVRIDERLEAAVMEARKIA